MENAQRTLRVDPEGQDALLALALQRVDLLVRRAALGQRLLGIDPNDPYRGLVLSDEEVDSLLHFPIHGGPPLPSHPELEALTERLSEVDAQLEALGHPPASRLDRLLVRLGLTPLDRDILLLGLLPEVAPGYGRLLAFVQDDVTRSRPCVFLSLRLLCADELGRALGRTRFLPAAPLIRHQLIRVLDHPHDLASSLLQRTVRVDERIVGYLLDRAPSDEAPFPFLRRANGGRPLEELLLPGEVVESLRGLLGGVAAGTVRFLLLQGTAGSGRRTAARSLGRALGRPLLEVLPLPEDRPDPPLLDRARLALREACLQQAVLFWPEGAERSRPALGELERLVEEYGVLVILSGERFPAPARIPAGTARVGFPLPGVRLRRRLWESQLDGRPVDGICTDDLALYFRMNAGQIRNALAWAEGLAQSCGRTQLEQRDLEQAVSFVVTPTLDDLARPITPRYTWDQIVVPPDVKSHLKEFTSAIRQRELVYDGWGFDRRRSLGRGLNALFAGPSGTGKTMAAEIIARELGLSLFKIDLSAVVSKYVGETEKHLRRLFAEAEQGNVILFFDEADALFGKRSEVRDAHDRYANIEVAYLLQALEEHAGVVVLATNLYGNMDDAFVRRMHFIVHFPFPEEDMRRGIWRVIFPAEAPLSGGVDFDDLARRFRVTGGHIRNIALGAAFLAADDGGSIDMEHLLQAARREFQKMGKIVDEVDFGPRQGPL